MTEAETKALKATKRREWYQANKDKQQEYNRRYWLKKLEKIAAENSEPGTENDEPGKEDTNE